MNKTVQELLRTFTFTEDSIPSLLQQLKLLPIYNIKSLKKTSDLVFEKVLLR